MSRTIIMNIPGNEINLSAIPGSPVSGSATEFYWGASNTVFGMTVARLNDTSVNGGAYARSLPSSPGGTEVSMLFGLPITDGNGDFIRWEYFNGDNFSIRNIGSLYQYSQDRGINWTSIDLGAGSKDLAWSSNSAVNRCLGVQTTGNWANRTSLYGFVTVTNWTGNGFPGQRRRFSNGTSRPEMICGVSIFPAQGRAGQGSSFRYTGQGTAPTSQRLNINGVTVSTSFFHIHMAFCWNLYYRAQSNR